MFLLVGYDGHSGWEGGFAKHAKQDKGHSGASSATVGQLHMQAVKSNSEAQELAAHQHETDPLDACPQMEGQAGVDGTRECVTVLTHQISELLKVIMHLSEALADSHNELMLRPDECKGQSRIPARTDQS